MKSPEDHQMIKKKNAQMYNFILHCNQDPVKILKKAKVSRTRFIKATQMLTDLSRHRIITELKCGEKLFHEYALKN